MIYELKLQCDIICYRTFLKDCPFVIKIRATDGQKLRVKEICGDHNHELSEVNMGS